MSENLAQTLRRNARVQLITWIWYQAIKIIRIMLLLRFLSASGYGLWIFSFTVLNNFAVYNFGIANAFVKYTAEYHAKKEYKRLGDLLGTGMLFGIAMGLAVCVLFFFFTGYALRFFNVQMENAPDARFVLLSVALATGFNMATGVYGAVLTGIQRLDLKNYAYVSVQNVEFFLLIAALNMGFGLRAVASLYAANMMISAFMCAWFVRRELPEVHINPFRPRRDCVRPLFMLGGKMQVLGIVSMFVDSLDIGMFMKYGSESFVGVYGAGQRFADSAQGLALQGFGMLGPASADLLARGEFDRLARVYGAAQRMTALCCVWLFGYLFFHADFTMHFVMGDKYQPAAVFALQALCVGYFFHTLTGPGTSMLRGAGRPLLEMTYQILTVILFFSIFFPWMYFIHAGVGNLPAQIIAAWPIALGTASFIFILLANAYFRVPLFAPFNETWPLLITACALAWGVRQVFDALPFATPSSRWTGLFAILPTGTAFTLLMVLAIYFVPGLPTGDKEQILRFVPGGHKFVRRLGLETPAA